MKKILPALLEKTARDSAAWESIDISALCNGQPKIISFLNAHAVTTAVHDPAFAKALMESDYLLRDGIGVKIALKIFGLEIGENLNGTDLIPHIIGHYPSARIALFGASDAAIQSAARRAVADLKLNPFVALEHGFHDSDHYLTAAEAISPDIIILCMGMPKQEILSVQLKESQSSALIICGGGWADFYSGIKRRAPLWVRRLSMEWMYRLFHEPKRLGKRYTIDIIRFFWVILCALFSEKE